MRISLPRIGLCVAFATVGAAAGWFSSHLLSNPAVRFAASHQDVFAAACAALHGAVAGLLLVPSQPQQEWLPPPPTPARITMVVLLAGMLAGALVALVLAPDELAGGAVMGLVCAALFIPAGVALVSAMRHVSRGRPGSIVARADLRAFLGVLAATLGCASALAVPAWPAAAVGLVPEPRTAVLFAGASGVFVLGLVLADLAALARIHRLRALSDEMESRRPEDALFAAPRIDFGLGEEVVAGLSPTATYRVAERPVLLLLGNAEQALAAVRQSLRWGVVGLGLLEAVAIGHGLARGTDVDASYSAWLCDMGRLHACRQAALLSEGAGHSDEEAARLHNRACDHGDPESCLALELLQRRRGPLW